MKKLSFIVFVLCLTFVSCSSDEDSQEEESKKLEMMYNEIVTLSLSDTKTCTDSKEWDFTSIGSTSCGSSYGYIAYSKKIDVPAFLKKVETYTNAEKAFNLKWKIISTCEKSPPPTSIECVEGKVKLYFLQMF